MRVLLVLPPLTQLNTPYPSTAYLAGFLRGRGHEVHQVDLGIELVSGLFSRGGLEAIFDEVDARYDELVDSTPVDLDHFLGARRRYERTVDPAVRFLQGHDATLATRIAGRRFLPEGPRFDEIGDLEPYFGELGVRDRARLLATRYLDDLADLVRGTIDPWFEFTRYAESLAVAARSYDPLAAALDAEPTLVRRAIVRRFDAAMADARPDVVGLSVPFPGNLFAALVCARRAAETHPGVPRVLGGGYVNTELRSLAEPRLFDEVDFVTLDDGERPWLSLLEHIDGARGAERLHRTFVRRGGDVVYLDGGDEPDIGHAELPVPDYRGLPLDRYLSVLSVPNPMHRLWSDGRWNKLTVAHGCYWKRCTFCDVTLDYIGRYDPAPAAALVDRVEALVEQTGESGFHFVDEAAPPAALRDLALELLRRDLEVSWWANIRFEKAFTPDLCRLLVASGCIAVSGGLEVASDRLLTLMDKGVTVEQVARVAHAFSEAGALVHAYLMYGFPTQTEQETVDALEVVRQLVAAGAVRSGYWHRFAMTVHSPVGRDPEAFGIEAVPLPDDAFAHNEQPFVDPTGVDHERLGQGLAAALYNYMHGVGLERPVEEWFAGAVPATSEPPDRIDAALVAPTTPDVERMRARLVWIGDAADWLADPDTGRTAGLLVRGSEGAVAIEADEETAAWMAGVVDRARPSAGRAPRLCDALESFGGDADALLRSAAWVALREAGLLLV